MLKNAPPRRKKILPVVLLSTVISLILFCYTGSFAFSQEEGPNDGSIVNDKQAAFESVQPNRYSSKAEPQSGSRGADDEVPGVPIPASGFQGYLDQDYDPFDVYAIYLREGMTFTVTMSVSGVSGSDFDPMLFPPGTTTLGQMNMVAWQMDSLNPTTMQYTVPPGASGVYYLNLWAYSGWGTYTVWYNALDHGPIGNLDSVQGYGGGLSASGWAIDPDSTDPIAVHLYVDGQSAAAITANQSRPDIGGAYPGYGNNHGFGGSISVAGGNHTVCAYGINVGLGNNKPLGCKAVYVPPVPVNPVGNLDSLQVVSGGIQANGWAFDPNTTDPINVHLYMDGQPAAAITANQSRPDIGNAYPGYGNNHGFTGNISAGGGSHTVCAYGINTGPGANSTLGCKTVNIPYTPVNPVGNLESVRMVMGEVQASGWTFDPNSTSPIDVHIYVDGQPAAAITANQSRPDIGNAFPGYGSDHGFSHNWYVPAGNHTVCAYAINVGPGANSTLGCKAINVPSPNPIGNLESVSITGGGLRAVGWALDPNTAAAIDVHVYVNGQFKSATTANVARSDIGNAFPAYGSAHGYDVTVTAGSGNNTLCAYGINQGAGNNSLLGCRNVTIP